MDGAELDRRFRGAIESFWDARRRNRAEQEARGVIDVGNRAEVTGGTQLGGLTLLIADLLMEAGLDQLDIKTRSRLQLPGYFRSEKQWDLLVVTQAGGVNRLVLAIEFKSMVGSTGKNLNNRADEIIGVGHDLQVALRESLLGADVPMPFVGFVVLVEDLREINQPVRSAAPYFKTDPIFTNKTYAERWDILCQRLVSEKLYTATCCEMIDRLANHRSLSRQNSFQAFAAAVEGHAVTFRKSLDL
jgi:hypothetical protein